MKITLDYGDSLFEWDIEGVVSSGTFVDGSPWVVVREGAILTSVSPSRERRTTTHTNSRYPTTVDVWINGSAKNPLPCKWHDANDPRPYGQIGTMGKNKWFMDGRICYSANGMGTQQRVDNDYDNDQVLNFPTPLAAGDVIVTAASEWYEPVAGEKVGDFIPNSPGTRRTPIKRIGVLTVLAEAPSEPCFRPPFQWIGTGRPAPIPVSSLRTDESALEHNSNIPYESHHYFSSPTYHEGEPISNQSSGAQYAITTAPNLLNSTVTYYGNGGSRYLAILLRDATNTRHTREQRDLARNRLIQYAIDAWGCTMSLVDTSSGAGHRGGEIKPWILLAGWWLNDESMKDVYQSIRHRYAGTAISNLPDKEIGYLMFSDDFVCRQVTDDPDFGYYIRQTWKPDSQYTVTSAETVESVNLFDYVPMTGKFAKLNVSKFWMPTSNHHTKAANYYGAYVKVTGGAGAGPTHYKVLTVGKNGSYPADFVILDRPWINGTPDENSTIELFAARNGTVDEDRSDIGRYHFSRNGQVMLPENMRWDDMSFFNDLYSMIAAGAFLMPYAALKRLRDTTGDIRYVSGETWGWLGEILLGTGTSVSDYTTRFGECPDEERIQHLGWDDIVQPSRHGLNAARRDMILKWLGDDAKSDYSRIPGFELKFDASGMSKLMANWGKAGGTDLNGDGTTDSMDLTFILNNWEE
jgi:hypothetical protein